MEPKTPFNYLRTSLKCSLLVAFASISLSGSSAPNGNIPGPITATGLGWAWFHDDLNGTYKVYPQDNLPGYCGMTTAANWVNVTWSHNKSLKGNGANYHEERHGHFGMRFELHAEQPISGPVDMRVYGTSVYYGLSNSTTHHNNGRSRSVTTINSKKLLSVASGIGEYSEDNDLYNATDRKYQEVVKNVTYTANSVDYSAFITLPSNKFTSELKVIHDPSAPGGNFTTAYGSSTCHQKIYISKALVTTPYDVATVQANVNSWEDRLEIYLEGDTWDIFKDSNGVIKFDFSDYSAGTHDIYVRCPKTLKKKFTVSFGSFDIVLGALALKYGDLNQDNQITTAEVQWVYNNIGKSSSDSDWTEPTTIGSGQEVTPSHCDIDEDGDVDSNDYNLVQNNGGQVGD